MNIYSEEHTCVTHLLPKILKEMVEEDLVLVGSSGFVIYDQDGMRGKLPVSFFVTLCSEGAGDVLSFKANITKFWALFFKKKNIFHSWLSQLLQFFSLKYTCLKRYFLSPHFAEKASPVLLKIFNSCSKYSGSSY